MNLARLELGVGLRRADDGQAPCAKLVDDAGNQRRFGSDYSQIRRWASSAIGQSTCAMPGLPGAAENFVAFLSEPPRDGVLASAASNDENFHAALALSPR